LLAEEATIAAAARLAGVGESTFRLPDLCRAFGLFPGK